VSPRIQVLNETLAALTQAAGRLAATHAGVDALFPLSVASIDGLAVQEQERLDAYAIRYARCQDLLFPAMRAFARAQLEPKADAGFLAVHALMEKQGIVGDRDSWERQRSLRNAVGHEYPDTAAIVDILNGIHRESADILAIVERLRQAADDL